MIEYRKSGTALKVWQEEAEVDGEMVEAVTFVNNTVTIPPKVQGGLAEIAAVVTETPEAENLEVSTKIQSSGVTLKAKRLACSNVEHAHLHKKKYKGFKRKREQYGIDADSSVLHTVHRRKLRVLLKSLMEQRRWTEASGVIGVLLNIPFDYHKDRNGLPGCRSDYWAGVMISRRLDDTQAGAMRCRRMFRLLERLQPNATCLGEIKLESALFLINQGDRDAAYNELRPIADGPLFRNDPVVHLCHGLNTHWLWYEAAVEENAKMDVKETRSASADRSSSPQEVMGETEARESSVDTSGGTDTSLRRGSPEGSLFSSDSHRQRGAIELHSSLETDASIWQASQRSIYEETNEEGFVEHGEQMWSNAIVPMSSELDPRLFPIRVVPDPGHQNQHYRIVMKDARTRDFHATAVKHLQQALENAPGTLPALLPLVQLLLAVHDINGAVQEIDRCAHALKNHFTPPSIKALLLESLKFKDYSMLEACYQKVLSLNPFSTWALIGLVKLHSSGKSKLDVLLDSMVLHLDATSGTAEVWRKLSSSLLVVAKSSSLVVEGVTEPEDPNQEEGQTSVADRGHLLRLLSSPRHQFWLKKHFSAEIMQNHQEQLPGDRWLLAYKAACTAHIYGPHFNIVEKVCRYLERKGYADLLKFIRRHRQNSLKLFEDQYTAE
ncbi:hypothetical protein R1flu_020498 [Riccia fluitans]|uniref:Uncharacterized protein n=1 Tax=Riccia fluitans TaxID=41844 RepID=A0ABD1ZN60_9MARC